MEETWEVVQGTAQQTMQKQIVWFQSQNFNLNYGSEYENYSEH